MAYKIIYNPAFPGAILIDNNTGTALPYAQNSLKPIWSIAAGTLEVRYNHNDFNPAMSATAFANILLSTDGSTFNAPSSFQALVDFVSQYLFEGGTGGGGGSVTIAGPFGQDVMDNSIPVVLASDQVVTEGGITVNIPITPAITASSAYAANMSIGGPGHFLNALRKVSGSGTLVSITVIDFGNQKAPIDFYFFSSSIDSGTYTDHTAVTPNATDFAKLIRKQSVLATDYSSVGTSGSTYAVADVKIHGDIIGNSSDQHIYVLAVCQGTPTYPATNSLILKAGFYQD